MNNLYTKKYSCDDIYAVLDRKIKEEMSRKNAYIQKNGYKHKETLNRFDERISMLSELYGEFK